MQTCLKNKQQQSPFSHVSANVVCLWLLLAYFASPTQILMVSGQSSDYVVVFVWCLCWWSLILLFVFFLCILHCSLLERRISSQASLVSFHSSEGHVQASSIWIWWCQWILVWCWWLDILRLFSSLLGISLLSLVVTVYDGNYLYSFHLSSTSPMYMSCTGEHYAVWSCTAWDVSWCLLLDDVLEFRPSCSAPRLIVVYVFVYLLCLQVSILI